MSESRTTETDVAPSRSAGPTPPRSAAHAAHPSDAPAAAHAGRRRAPARRLAALRPSHSDHPTRTRIANVVLAVFVIVFCVFLYQLNTTTERVPLRPTGGSEFARATVDEVLTSNTDTSDEGEMSGNQTVTLTIDSGTYAGTTTTATSPFSNNSGAYCTPGLHVVILANAASDGSVTATVYNYDRSGALVALIVVFLALLCLVGGRAGITSAVGLVFTFACIFWFFLPMVYRSASPFWCAVATVILVTVVGIYLIGGCTVKTLCSILGTVAGVLIAGVVCAVFGSVAHISGLNVTDIETLAYIGQNSEIDVGGLLFAGILISSLGAVMDVSMSVASAVCELKSRNASLGFTELFRSGMTVGRDMMGTMTHALILAFAGSALNTLVIIYAYSMPYLQYMNEYDIGIEIMRGLSGSFGIILTVPFVSFACAALLARRKHQTSVNDQVKVGK